MPVTLGQFPRAWIRTRGSGESKAPVCWPHSVDAEAATSRGTLARSAHHVCVKRGTGLGKDTW